MIAEPSIITVPSRPAARVEGGTCVELAFEFLIPRVSS